MKPPLLRKNFGWRPAWPSYNDCIAALHIQLARQLSVRPWYVALWAWVKGGRP